jgi:hypothetical protein
MRGLKELDGLLDVAWSWKGWILPIVTGAGWNERICDLRSWVGCHEITGGAGWSVYFPELGELDALQSWVIWIASRADWAA